jgi:hypothetical protein
MEQHEAGLPSPERASDDQPSQQRLVLGRQHDPAAGQGQGPQEMHRKIYSDLRGMLHANPPFSMWSSFTNVKRQQCLRKMNNFNTLMGIIAGLNTASVNRLKAIKTDMAKKLLTVRHSSPLLSSTMHDV